MKFSVQCFLLHKIHYFFLENFTGAGQNAFPGTVAHILIYK
jgi:hypothetical protein